MKGFKDSSGKFHPMNDSKGVRKSRDQSTKLEGVRMKRTPIKKKYKFPLFSLWDTQTDRFLGSGRNEKDLELTLEDGITFLVEGSPDPEMTEEQSYKMSGLTNGNIKKQIEYLNAFGLKVINHPKEIPDEGDEQSVEALGEQDYEEVERKAREFSFPLKQKKIIGEELGDEDFDIISHNPKWKLTHIITDDGEFYVFPDEDSAITFGRQSIRDTASEYIPDEGSPNRDEYINLSDDDLVEKIIDEQSDFGQRSELGAIAQSVAGYDGQFHELSDGTIAFQIS